MNRAVPLFLFLSCALIGAEEKNTVQIKEEDIKELEALKKASIDSPAKPITISEGVTITPLSSDAQELEALKKQMGEEPPQADSKEPKEKSYSGQIVQKDEEETGFELFLYNDGKAVPILFLIQSSNHEVGEKITVSGIFDGAIKFGGSYYPVLKSSKPDEAQTIEANKGPTTAESALGVDSPHEHINGFQLSNILFVIFITASLAIVGVRIKKILDEKKKVKSKNKK